MHWQPYKQEQRVWASRVSEYTFGYRGIDRILLCLARYSLTDTYDFSEEWCRNRNREKDPITPDRRLIARESRRHLSQHRLRL